MVKKLAILNLILFYSILLVFSGCGTGEVEIYPPIVFKAMPGAFSGPTIDKNLEVKVVDAQTTKELQGAHVFIHQGNPMELIAEGTTDADGKVSFTGEEISGAVTVTVTGCEEEAYDTVSFIDINSSNMIIPITLRKSRSKVKTALTFPGLSAGDERLTYYINDQPKAELELTTVGKTEPDPHIVRVLSRPLAFSAMAMDAAENTTKFGFTVVPEGPIPVKTPTMLKMNKVNTETVKIVNGNIEFPPSNLELPQGGWDPSKYYSLGVFADAGIAGAVFAGFGNVTSEYNYQAFCCRTSGLKDMYLLITAFNRKDSWAEMSMIYLHSEFNQLPKSHDFKFKQVPKLLHTENVENSLYPVLKWIPGQGDLNVVTIRHDEYDYNWKIYSKNNSEKLVVFIPPIKPGSAGALLSGAEYRFQVETWSIDNFNYNAVDFQQIRKSITDKVRSKRYRFTIQDITSE